MRHARLHEQTRSRARTAGKQVARRARATTAPAPRRGSAVRVVRHRSRGTPPAAAPVAVPRHGATPIRYRPTRRRRARRRSRRRRRQPRPRPATPDNSSPATSDAAAQRPQLRARRNAGRPWVSRSRRRWFAAPDRRAGAVPAGELTTGAQASRRIRPRRLSTHTDTPPASTHGAQCVGERDRVETRARWLLAPVDDVDTGPTRPFDVVRWMPRLAVPNGRVQSSGPRSRR